MKDNYYRYDAENHALSGICVMKIRTEDNIRVGLVTNVQSSQKAAGKGWIKALFKELIDDADHEGCPLLLSVEAGYDPLHPDTQMDTQRLINLYKSFGFVMMDESTGDYPAMRRDPHPHER